MISPQIESTTTLARNHKVVFDKLVNGPVFLANRSKPVAAVLSIGDYDQLVNDANEGKRLQRIAQYDQTFAEMRQGKYTEG
jgi:PHD/YefM family antitoxin component YafN of YafNO toxin-antitoxin module